MNAATISPLDCPTEALNGLARHSSNSGERVHQFW